MRLATPTEVLQVLNIQSSPGSLDSAGVALDSTFDNLEEWLESSLQESEQTDYFNIRAATSEPVSLRLTNAFVSDATPIVVKTHDLNTVADGTVLTADAYLLDSKLGIVRILGSGTLHPCTFSVQYVSGYPVAQGDANTLTGAPDPIKQAHRSLAAAYLQLNPANVPKDKSKALGTASIKGYQQAAKHALRSLTRPRGIVRWPDMTVPIP